MQVEIALLTQLLLLNKKIHDNQVAFANQLGLNTEQEEMLEESRQMLRQLANQVARIRESIPENDPPTFFEN